MDCSDARHERPLRYGKQGALLQLESSLHDCRVPHGAGISWRDWRLHRAASLARIVRELRDGLVAVRSDRLDEGSSSGEHAGRYRTVLGVAADDAEAVADAVDSVFASYETPRAGDGVFVQRQVTDVRHAAVVLGHTMPDGAPYLVVSIAPADAQPHLRNGLAMGANRAIHIAAEGPVAPLAAARAFLKLIEKEAPGLVLMGKQAIDDDASQTGQMLATLWKRPQATFASKLQIEGEKATVTREVDAGLETLEIDLPAVVTTDLRLNEPRFIKLPDIMKAKSKPLETVALTDFDIGDVVTPKAKHYAAPAQRGRGVMVKDAAELVAKLKEKGLL